MLDIADLYLDTAIGFDLPAEQPVHTLQRNIVRKINHTNVQIIWMLFFPLILILLILIRLYLRLAKFCSCYKL